MNYYEEFNKLIDDYIEAIEKYNKIIDEILEDDTDDSGESKKD